MGRSKRGTFYRLFVVSTSTEYYLGAVSTAATIASGVYVVAKAQPSVEKPKRAQQQQENKAKE